MKKRVAAVLMLAVLIALACVGIKALEDRYYENYSDTSKLSQENLDASLVTNYSFVTEPWTGNNQPYHTMREKVDQALATGQNADDLLRPAKIAAHENPTDSQAQFLWAYVAYQAETTDLKRAQLIPDRKRSQAAMLVALNKLGYVREALAEAPSPHAYDYSRIHFLVAANTDQAGEEIRPLAVRLLHYDPTDFVIETHLISLLEPGRVPGDLALGLALVKDEMRRYPSLAEPHVLRCTLYQSYWSYNGFHRGDAQRAIAECHLLLAYLPADYPFRQTTVQDIQQIEILQAFEEKQRRQGKISGHIG